jgi:hypothetical protein
MEVSMYLSKVLIQVQPAAIHTKFIGYCGSSSPKMLRLLVIFFFVLNDLGSNRLKSSCNLYGSLRNYAKKLAFLHVVIIHLAYEKGNGFASY